MGCVWRRVGGSFRRRGRRTIRATGMAIGISISSSIARLSRPRKQLLRDLRISRRKRRRRVRGIRSLARVFRELRLALIRRQFLRNGVRQCLVLQLAPSGHPSTPYRLYFVSFAHPTAVPALVAVRSLPVAFGAQSRTGEAVFWRFRRGASLAAFPRAILMVIVRFPRVVVAL